MDSNNPIYCTYFTLNLSIFWTDQSKGERRRQAIQPSLKHQPIKYIVQNTEPRPDHNTGNSMAYCLREVCGFFNISCYSGHIKQNTLRRI